MIQRIGNTRVARTILMLLLVVALSGLFVSPQLADDHNQEVEGYWTCEAYNNYGGCIAWLWHYGSPP